MVVEGIDVGKDVDLYVTKQCKNGCTWEGECNDCQGSTRIDTQDFRDADMVVVDAQHFGVSYDDEATVEAFKEAEQVKDFMFHAYAVYGNKVVHTHILGSQLKDLENNIKRVVWSKNKPYILNGDLSGHRIITFI